MVKETRKRGIIYFDSIDLEILEFINKPNYKENTDGWGVLEIANNLNISHISLKPHIDKLLRLELIHTITTTSKNEKPRTFLLTTPPYNYFVADMNDLDKKELERIKKENEKFEIILSCLKKVRGLFYEEERNKLLYIDLRKKPKEDKKIKTSKKVTSKK